MDTPPSALELTVVPFDQGHGLIDLTLLRLDLPKRIPDGAATPVVFVSALWRVGTEPFSCFPLLKVAGFQRETREDSFASAALKW